MGIIRITAPTEEPVTLAEAKAHLRIAATDEDALIGSLIMAAREYAEARTHLKLVSQTWRHTRDDLPSAIQLPYPPLMSIESVTYVDSAGVRQTVASTVYEADVSEAVGICRLAYNQTWPSYRFQPNSIEITYVCGYGTAMDVPQALKQAMLLHIGHMFENREAVAGTTMTAVPMAVESLLSTCAVRVVA